MLKTLVVGIDGTPVGRRAFDWALNEATEEVHAIHAVSPSIELAFASVQIDTGPMIARLTEQLHGEWTASGHDVPPKVFTRLLEDNPANALISIAQAEDADAIVVGARGHETSSRIIGATTSHIVHLCNRPVVVMPAPDTETEPAPAERIVVALGDHPSDDAELVAWATSAARGPETRLELVHTTTKAHAGSSDEVADRLQQWVTTLGVGLDSTVSTSGDDPITALVDASEGASMVVVGSHRSNRLAAYLTGALSNHLPTVSRCPVVLVPLTVARH